MGHLREELVKKIPSMMRKKENIRNIGIVAHIHHGKTTLSDNLLAAAGMISEEKAGKQLYLNYDEQEQERKLTINNAAVSIVHGYEGKEYLINLIDTPGHVDFGGDVTRAMRVVDGAIVLVCAVEGVMAQTETVLRQALKEKVKPVLFINKVDRAINELKLTSKMMQERFVSIIEEVNQLIYKMAPPEFRDKWYVRVEDGSVAFGSAYQNWAISWPYMKKTNISFKDIYELSVSGNSKDISNKAKINDVVFDMVVKHLPDPIDAQKYRTPNIWHGDINSKIGKDMLTTNVDGDTAFMVTDITIDPNAGEIATGRLFSGKLKKGLELYIAGTKIKEKVQQVNLFMGPERLMVEEVTAGNVAAIIGFENAIVGVTLTTNPEMEPFEEIVHVSEPVVTIAIEPKNTQDLPKLIDTMKKVAKEDASLRVEINNETGEHLLSGMGELHLEITVYRIINDHKVPIEVSKPIVVYRESVLKEGGPFEGKSPNKHNRFYLEVSPLDEKVVKLIKDGEIPHGRKFKDIKQIINKLVEAGMERDEAKGIQAVYGDNMFIDYTKGIQNLNETMELCLDAFDEVMAKGPLASEKISKVKVKLVDAKLHEDSIHRGPAQVIPAVRNSIYGALCQGKRILLEPLQKVIVNTSQDLLSSVTRELQKRRGEILDLSTVGDYTTITAKVPVAEMFGFSDAIRSATAGKVMWNTENMGFEKVPAELLNTKVAEIRTRKGLKPEPYDEAYYSS